MPSGINFLHRTQKADFKGNGRQGICGILTSATHVDFQFLAALPSRWKMLVIHEGQEAHGKADYEDQDLQVTNLVLEF